MGQDRILNLLKRWYRKNPDAYYTSKEISKALHLGGCSTPLKALRKHEEVDYIDTSLERGIESYIYRYKPEKLYNPKRKSESRGSCP
jgi:hypothetical protein